ncbi:MAG: MBL fold metallo-hydrolase [Clostridia bacterium]|nr:MBL fold metallo-hydrolase [Clostridia bacterium]
MTFKFCSIASGSSGNCYVIASQNSKILLDAGVSGKKITAGLNSVGVAPEEIEAILVTHEHTDHIKGAGIFSRKYDTPIYANEATWQAMQSSIGKVKEHNIKTFTTGEEMLIKDVDIKSYHISHDAVEPVGFSFYKNDVQVSIATDLGCMTSEILEEITHADFLVLEANHDIEMLKMGRYPWYLKKRILSEKGHLSNIDAGKALTHILKTNDKERDVLLAHLSHENNFPQMAYQTVKNILEEENIYIGQDIRIHTALREETSEIYPISKKVRCY